MEVGTLVNSIIMQDGPKVCSSHSVTGVPMGSDPIDTMLTTVFRKQPPQGSPEISVWTSRDQCLDLISSPIQSILSPAVSRILYRG